MSKKKRIAPSVSSAPPIVAAIEESNKLSSNKWYPWIIMVFSFLLYANTLNHDYTQDDAIVIYDNMFTTKGIEGIPGLLKYDTFYGFFKTEGKAKLVSGGRYRPLTPIMFAVEYQIFEKNPFVGHFINVVLYALLCLLIYFTLRLLLRSHADTIIYLDEFILMTTLIFAAHPLHTEVVANIKGRDEIMSMFGAVFTLFFTLKYIDNRKVIMLIGAFISFFLGMMSKENTITYLGVIPLALLVFRDVSVGKIFKVMFPAISAALLFILIRSIVLGFDIGGTPMELMNNPFLKISGNAYVPFSLGEKMATIIYTLGKYVLLLFFPHPLTHDYYPRHIEIMNMVSYQVVFSMLVYAGMIFAAYYYWKRDRIITFSIIYFLMTLSIVSNIVFPIGTNMSERFMFMPSMAMALLSSYIIFRIVKNRRLRIGLISIILVTFAAKTYTRNQVWKNDFTLFTTDVKTSKNSAKVNNAAGGALVTEAFATKDEGLKNKYLDQAIPYLQKALEIHPNYKNAALLLGNAYYYKNDYDNAVNAYDRALVLDSNFEEANKNLAIALRDGGRYAGEKHQDLEKAQKFLNRSIKIKDNDPEAYRLLAITYGIMGNHQKAIELFEKVSIMEPNAAGSYVNLGKAYQNFGDDENAMINFQKAIQLDPSALEKQ